MKTIQNYNLHSHTSRCGHAEGLDYEYVEHAIKAGFEIMGFSDHVFLPGIIQDGIRGRYSNLEGYLANVSYLKEEYAERIKIYSGLECEWYGDRFEKYYRYLLSRDDVDFLILGQHCLLEDGLMVWYYLLPIEERLARYEQDLIAGMESGLFTYVCHPDLYCRWESSFNQRSSAVAHHIAQAAERLHIPLEINAAPVRSMKFPREDEKRLIYPCPDFWKIVAQYDVDVLIGVDAHSPHDYDITDYEYLMEFAHSLGLKLLKECPLKPKSK